MTQEEWQAIKNRDSAYDGVFFYAVRTTGNICRPSCASRRCNPGNIIIFHSFKEALSEGYHPCGRCRPDLPEWNGAKAELAQKAKKYIEENYLDKFSLDTLADALYINKYYLVRAFKESEGFTPLWYHNKVRSDAAAKLLERPDYSISYICDTVGFNNASHFARVFKAYYGVSPTEYRRGYLDKFN